jgi:hypothetical protein
MGGRPFGAVTAVVTNAGTEAKAMGADKAETAGGQGLTPRQQKWFATVKANFEAQTGKPMADWVAIARTCPHDGRKARGAWLKEHHGIGSNHAAFILSEAFPEGPGWDDAAELRAQLWSDPKSEAILSAIEEAANGLPDLVEGQRKSFTSFSKAVQFAAARPLKGGKALLGLKLDPSASPRLQPSLRKESWSERLIAIVEFDDPSQVDGEIKRLLGEAYNNG